MAKTIHSGNLTFIDLTDSKKVDVHISSNLPTIQIYDTNATKATCSPDWTSTPLKLTLAAYADSTNITNSLTNDNIVWYRQIGSGDYVEVQRGGIELQISNNELIDEAVGLSAGVISYICQIKYNNKTFENKSTFARTDTGRNGTSVNILGKYATLAELQTAHPIGNVGDAYVINGHLYAWTADDLMWEDCGNIQGPAGEDAKSIVLTSSSQVFKATSTDTNPATITVTASTINFDGTISWEYALNNGGFATLKDGQLPSGFTFDTNKKVKITGKNLSSEVTSIILKASYGAIYDVLTLYKAEKGDPASMAFLTNENISFSADASGQMALTTFTTNVVAYRGETKTTPTIGTILDLPAGMTVVDPIIKDDEAILIFTIAAKSDLGADTSTSGTITIPVTSPVSTSLKLSWSKINAGAKGAQGNKGDDAYTVMLTNESYIFAGDIDHAYASSVETQILGYKGATQQSVTIISVDGKTASTIDTATSIEGLKFKCSALSGQNPTITFTCTESFTNASGAIPIVVSINGISFTRMFNYSIAFKGATGDTGGIGPAGAPATAYWLVSSASAVQKTSTGTIAVTPSTLTFTGKSKTGANTPTDYACRWVIEYSTDGANYTNLYTSTVNEASKTVTVATTYKTIRARMYLAGGTATLLDEQIIPVISDGAKGEIGNTGRGVSSIVEQYYQSTSATTQADGTWSTTVPTWADGKYIWTRSVITYTDSTTSTTSPVCVTGQKGGIGGTGVGVSSVDVWYYQSTSATTLSGGSWSTTSPTWSDGKYVWTKTIITYTNSTTDETAAVCITGQKGSTGVGIKSVTEYYLATSSSSGVTISTSGWTTAIQTITVDKKYLWNYEVITYTDNTTSTTTPIVIGTFGDTGKGIKSVTEYYLATTLSSGVTTATTGWTTTMQALTAANKYLWNYELITYTDNTTATINPVIIGVYGDKGNQGNPGVGISSVTVTYGTSISASTQPTSWQTTIPTVDEGSYLWTRTITDYTDSSVADTVTYTYTKQGKTPIKGTDYKDGTSVTVSSIQYQASTSATTAPTGTWSNSVVSVAEGSYLWTKTTFSDGKVAYGVAKQGQKGSDAYTVILTNESHVFAGTVSTAVASSATTQVLAYKGGVSQSVTIVSVDGKTASTSSTATSIAGLSFVCSALSGTSPTITFTCTTSFVSPSGTIPIVLTVDGVTVTKIFTYGIAFKGTVGTPASLVDITPSAHYFKSTTGKDGIFTPDYIYLYPRFQTVTYSKWEYSTNGGTSWTTVTSGSNGLTIGTYNSVANSLQIAKTSALYTDSITSVSFRCVSSTASIYDTVSIAKIYDVVDLQIGGRNLAEQTNQGTTNWLWSMQTGDYTMESYVDSNQIECCKFTKGTTTAQTGWSVIEYTNIGLLKYEPSQTYTISFDVLSNVTTTMSVRLLKPNGTNDLAGAYTPINKQVTANVWSKIIYTTTTVATLPELSDQCLYITGMSSTNGTSYIFKNVKIEKGNKATDWSPAPEDLKTTTFQIYAPKGYLLTNSIQELTLETFAYDGSQSITNAEFAWSSWDGEAWVTISGETGASLTVNKGGVFKSGLYRCQMTYHGDVYTATATVDDKTDAYESLIRAIAKYSPTNRHYWILYATVYSEEGERDALLGPISEVAPTNPATGSYWYQIDETNYTATLMQYSGTAWVAATATQDLHYDWVLFKDADDMVALGKQSKVVIITSNDFSKSCDVQCNIFDSNNMLLSRNNQTLIDPSDPVVAQTAPQNPVDGQLWIQLNNGSYIIYIWNAADKKWIMSEADSQNKVYTEKPTNYTAGDIWIVGGDYQPTIYLSGTAQATKYLAGSMLKAQYTSDTYKDSDWVEALSYKKQLDEVADELAKYKQYISIDDTGLIMEAKNANGQLSEFKTKLTNTELGFYQGDDKVAYINNNQLNISKAQITNGLSVSGTSPVLTIGGFSFIQEGNGSLSIITNI